MVISIYDLFLIQIVNDLIRAMFISFLFSVRKTFFNLYIINNFYFTL